MSTPTTSTTDTASYKQQQQQSAFSLTDHTTPQQIVQHLDLPLNSPDYNEILIFYGSLQSQLFGKYRMEGIDLTSKIISKRKVTVEKILKTTLEQRIVLLRSPPFSGKTSLCLLLSDYIQRHHQYIELVQFTNLVTSNAQSKQDFDRCWILNTSKTWDEWITVQPTDDKIRVIIFDEAQSTYDNQFYKSSWSIIKNLMGMKNNRIHILFMATYGDIEMQSFTPVPFQSQNCLGMQDILLTRQEYDEILLNFNTDMVLNSISKFSIEEDIANFLYKITRGHVGLIRLALNIIENEFVTRTEIRQSDLKQFIISPRLSQEICKTRAIPNIIFDKDMTNVLKKIIISKNAPLEGTFKETVAVTTLYKYGVIVSMKNQKNESALYFISPLVRSIYFCMLNKPHDYRTMEFKKLNNFVQTLLAQFDHETIDNTLSNGTDGFPLEEFWQTQVYFYAKTILPLDKSIHPTVGHDDFFSDTSEDTKMSEDNEEAEDDEESEDNEEAEEDSKMSEDNEDNLKGRIVGDEKKQLGLMDFYINSTLKWGLELTRQGSKLENHLARFQPGGLYYNFMDKVDDYLVLDFRSEDKKIRYHKKYPLSKTDKLWR
eukprot:gene11619-14227_t